MPRKTKKIVRRKRHNKSDRKTWGARPPFKLVMSRSFGHDILCVRTSYNLAGNPGSYLISGSVAAVAGTPVFYGGVFGINITEIDLLSAYQSLFDQYRIVGCEMTFNPMFNTDSAAGTTNYLGELATVIDYDDATTPSAFSVLRSYENVKITNCQTKQVRRFVPHLAVSSYTTGGVFAGYTNMKDQWIDMAYPTVQHYGIKFGFSGSASVTTVPQYMVDTVIMLQFKSIR